MGRGQQAALGLIRLYRAILSPLLGRGCRFYPSCSEYASAVIERDGVMQGSLRALGRVARCTPFQRGGIDLP